MEGYEALRSSAAWLDLGGRGLIEATGEDRTRLLHAITTNHIEQLAAGEGCYAFLLNAQGRIQADVNVLAREDRFWLDTEPETAVKVLAHIDHYIIADDVTLEDLREQFAVLAVEGPEAAGALAPLAIPVPEAPYSHQGWENARLARLSATGLNGYRLFVPAAEKAGMIAKLEAAGVPAAGAEAVRVVRLEHARPRYGPDIFDTTLAQETQQLHAVHFNKGCYLGQEIVERVRSRGMVHRLLVGLTIEGTEAPMEATPVMAGGKETGRITSAAFSPAMKQVVALAYVRRENAEPGTLLECVGRRATVRAPYSEPAAG